MFVTVRFETSRLLRQKQLRDNNKISQTEVGTILCSGFASAAHDLACVRYRIIPVSARIFNRLFAKHVQFLNHSIHLTSYTSIPSLVS